MVKTRDVLSACVEESSCELPDFNWFLIFISEYLI